jgi:hypothetical protein
MIKFNPTQNIIEVYETYNRDYSSLNWNESLTEYMNNSLEHFYKLNGTLYHIEYNKSNIGHFTIYNFKKDLRGIGMFHIKEYKGMSIGQVNSLLREVRDFFNQPKMGVFGFCNNVRILRLYLKLGYNSKLLGDRIYLVFNPYCKDYVTSIEFTDKDYF